MLSKIRGMVGTLGVSRWARPDDCSMSHRLMTSGDIATEPFYRAGNQRSGAQITDLHPPAIRTNSVGVLRHFHDARAGAAGHDGRVPEFQSAAAT
jgi:hypothetical protein